MHAAVSFDMGHMQSVGTGQLSNTCYIHHKKLSPDELSGTLCHVKLFLDNSM